MAVDPGWDVLAALRRVGDPLVGASVEGGGCRDAEVWWFTGGVKRRRAGAVIAKCSHCIVLSPLPAGGSRHGTGGMLADFPTFRLSNFPVSRLLGFLVCWRCGWWWWLRVCGYSEALMRISERGASGLLNESLPPRRGGGRKAVAVSSCFCYTTRLNESLPGLPAKGGTGRNRGLGEEFTAC